MDNEGWRTRAIICLLNESSKPGAIEVLAYLPDLNLNGWLAGIYRVGTTEAEAYHFQTHPTIECHVW